MEQEYEPIRQEWDAWKYKWTTVEDAIAYRKQFYNEPFIRPEREWRTALAFDEELARLPATDLTFAVELYAALAVEDRYDIRLTVACSVDQLYIADKEVGTAIFIQLVNDEEWRVRSIAHSTLDDAAEEGRISVEDAAPLLHEYKLSRQRYEIRSRDRSFGVIEGEGQG